MSEGKGGERGRGERGGDSSAVGRSVCAKEDAMHLIIQTAIASLLCSCVGVGGRIV